MTKKPINPGKKKSYVPDRGDIIWLELDPQSGREQAGRRPCLVLSPALYNGKTGLAVVCPITNQAKGYSFEVALPISLKTTGVVLADHIKNLDWRSRKAEFREKLSESVVREVLDMTMKLLDPDEPAEESNGEKTDEH
jgi:mRNA interferase MazF